MTTSLKLPQTAKLSSEDAARTMGKTLVRAKTFEAPAILLVDFPSDATRQHAATALETYLRSADDTLVDLDLRQSQPVKVLNAISNLKDNEVASVHGLHAQPEVVGQLNWGRERLTDANKRIVLWLNPEESKDLLRRAPDFWRFRNRHLVLAPSSENEDRNYTPQPYYYSILSLSNLSAEAKRDRIAALEELLETVLDPKSSRAQTLRDNVAQLHWEIGQYEHTIKYLQQALQISREIGDRQGEGSHLGNLGIAYSNVGEVQKAIEHYQQALQISREIGDRQGEGNSLGNLGIAYSNLGKVEEALAVWLPSFEISRAIQSPSQTVVFNWLVKLQARDPNFGPLLRNLFPSGDNILNKATGQSYTFYKDAPPDMPDHILKLLDEYAKNPQA